MRSIVHFYIPSFLAAVEQLKKPELAGRPVLVTHRSGSADFIVSASSEAMAEGAREGMTVRHARRYCPYGAFIPADWGTYKDISNNVLDILSGYSPLLEPHWLDRAYMEGLGRDQGIEGPVGSDREASNIQQIIREETGLVISAGIGENKLIAQAAASVCKAGECMVVRPGMESEFLAPLLVNNLPGIGPKIEKRLLALGVSTIGELAAIPCTMLVRQFGAIGSKMHRLANGVDYNPVKALYPPETIISEHTFDLMGDAPSEPDAVQEYLLRMSGRVASRLRKQNQKSGALTLRLEFGGGEVRSRSYVPKSPITSTHEIYSAARRILRQEMYGLPVTSVRLTLSDLRTVEGLQLSFLEDAEKKMRLQAMMDNIQAKFGERSIVYGTALVE